MLIIRKFFLSATRRFTFFKMCSVAKKGRSRNFNDFEKNLVFNIVKDKYLNIIENKKTDGVTVANKNKAWVDITNEFNCQAQTGTRTPKQIHALYDIMKKTARSNLHEDKRQMYKTGGGRYFAKSGVLDEIIVETLKPQFESLKNRFDSSADYHAVPSTDRSNSSATTVVEDAVPSYSEFEENELIAPYFEEIPVVQPPSPFALQEFAGATSNSADDIQTVKAPKTRTEKRKSISQSSEKKKKCVDLLTNRLIKRKNFKDQHDEEIKEHKKRILLLEEKIKKEQLEGIIESNRQNLELFEINMAIKRKELEARQKEIEYHSLLVSSVKRKI